MNGIREKLRSLFEGRSESLEEKVRRKLFTFFLFLLIIPLFLFGTAQLRQGAYIYGITDFIVAFLLIAFLIILKYMKRGKVIYRISSLLLMLLLFYWIQSGAVNGYASVWALAFPPYIFFLMGKREGMLWSTLLVLVTALLFINPFSALTNFTYPPEFISRHLFSYFVIFLATYNYESLRVRYQQAMEAEQKNLLLEKERLTEARDELESVNLRLKEEMEERKRAEEELRQHYDRLEEMVRERTLEIQEKNRMLMDSQRLYKLLSENVNDLIWATDLDLRFTFISPSVTRLYGYTVEEAMRLPHDKWNTPESLEKIIEAYRREMALEMAGQWDAGKYVFLELEQYRKDGTIFSVELKVSFLREENGRAIGIVGITRDITERKQAQQEKEEMQEQLAQAQKMEALGTLVGGIAHDFNNLLGGIIGSLSLLEVLLQKENLSDRESIEEYLHLGMESSKRSADLIKRLLILSKKHEIILAPINIADSLSHIHELCRNSFPKSIALHFPEREEALMIMGDAVQVEQVLLNLCINASHAMTIMRPPGAKQGGTLTVTVGTIKSDCIMREHFPEITGIVGSWVRVQITDTGVGMDAETKKRIFEPFFSLKSMHTGSGLGLATSYNIIQKHGGFIHVYSEPGSGSSFSLYFPEYNVEKGGYHADFPGQGVIRGSGTVLVIDDETIILNVAKGFLEQCGYRVITAGSALEGIEVYRERQGEIDAVLIDLSMPDKSGLEVYHELSTINPDVRVLLSSGMLDNQSREQALQMGIRDTVHKPYLAGELSVKMKALME